MKKELVIIGAGGHAKVVLDAVKSQNEYTVKGFCVDGLPKGQLVFDTFPVLDDVMLSSSEKDLSIYFIVAIGDNDARQKLFENARNKFTPARIVHSSAVLGSSLQIAGGTVVLANAVINASVSIGENCIIGTGVLIDHDCTIGNHVHLNIGSVIGSKSIVSNKFKSSVGEKIESASQK